MNVVWYGYKGRKYPTFVVECPYCKERTVVLYPSKYIVCHWCKRIFVLEPTIVFKMIDLCDKYGDITQYAPTREWQKIREEIYSRIGYNQG